MKSSLSKWMLVIVVAICVIPVLVIRGLPVPGMARDYSTVTVRPVEPAEYQPTALEIRYEELKKLSVEEVNAGIDDESLTQTDLMLLLVRALSYNNRAIAQVILSRTETPRLLSFSGGGTEGILFDDADPELIALFVRYRLDEDKYEKDGLTLREHYEKRYDQIRVMVIDRAERVRAGEESEVQLGEWVQKPQPQGVH